MSKEPMYFRMDIGASDAIGVVASEGGFIIKNTADTIHCDADDIEELIGILQRAKLHNYKGVRKLSLLESGK